MRYGVVREVASLPPVGAQHAIMAARGCDILISDTGPAPLWATRLAELMPKLEAGDELLLPSLDVFLMTTAEIYLALDDLLTAGVVVRICDSADSELALVPGDAAAELVGCVSKYERDPPRLVREGRKYKSASGSRNPLSRYQVEYARKMLSSGVSLEALTRLFEQPGETILKEISKRR